MARGSKGKIQVDTKDEPRIAVIRTSDRNSFKMCRRKWHWTSHLRMNLGSIQTGDPLWLGSGMHFALEDFHGLNQYGTPGMAFMAFIKAYRDKYPNKVPEDWNDLGKLGVQMMDYYPIWLKGRDPLETYVHNGVPQVEPSFKIPIDWKFIEPLCSPDRFRRIRALYDEVIYSLTLDRVIVDEHGQLWIVEYKSAKAMQTAHFLNDPQVTTYVWGANTIYQEPVAGVIYQQHKKAVPNEPRLLQNGTFSVAQNQSVTHRSYRDALIRKYGEVKKAPGENIKYLNSLAKGENEDFDAFIRRDKIYRNKAICKSISQQILLETCDMLDPELPLYPAPSRMCSMMCGMMGPCVSMDDGGDWESDLADETEVRPKGYDEWRTELPEPATFKGVKLV